MSPARRTIGILAFTQIASWGALYYAFAVLAPDIQRDLGMGKEAAFAAFSWSLLVAGVAATPVGALVDRRGGQGVMALGSVVCAIGLAWLSRCTTLASYWGAWTVIGLAMSLTLYEAAFATINRKLDAGAPRAISTLTLFAGFASTIFWPLTLALSSRLGWRDTYLAYAGLQLAACLPLHLWLGRDAPRAPLPAHAPRDSHTLGEAVRHPAFWKLALAFSANVFIFSALAIHLIPLLQSLGHAAGTAVLLAALVGPMQVAGRVGERVLGRDAAPQVVGRFVFSTLPAGLLALALVGTQAWGVVLFCMLYGMSNGVLTIIRGTLPRALFGARNYGAITGAMAVPSLLSKAVGPLAGAALLSGAAGPLMLPLVLTGCALASLLLYLSAIRAPAAALDAARPASYPARTSPDRKHP
ncbi:MFS transporter [Massilia sp. DD77]|uniref:MFS transporter n=1 Tax=Massilia sp. DD77 TaxID=3109349 RepID=UPI002FFE21E6